MDTIHEYHVILGALKENEEMRWGEMYLVHPRVLPPFSSSSNLTPRAVEGGWGGGVN